MDFFQRYIEFINKNNPFMIHNGISLTKLTKDYAEAEVVTGPDSLNFMGTMHGGLHFTIADVAACAAARSDGINYVTLGGSFDYIRSAGEGKARAVAEVRHRGRTVCRVAVKVLDERDRLLADGNFTMYSLNQPFFKEE
ncbi:MAG TPA: PaaI family thioesterase [Clostridiales bacterium]|jgi:acyl-CoA thioesterase|nr:PaaI family thioesterase [Clostridiales bacterium]